MGQPPSPPGTASRGRARTPASRSRSRSAAISSAQGLQPGDRIGTEQELATEFGVSRPTLREGLRLLASSHLIRVGRGRSGGIFVARTPERGHEPQRQRVDLDDAGDRERLARRAAGRAHVPRGAARRPARRANADADDRGRAAGGDRRRRGPRAGHAAVQRRRHALPPDPRRGGRQRAAARVHRLDPRGAAAAR